MVGEERGSDEGTKERRGRGAGLKTGVTYRYHPGIFTGRQMPITREMK